MISSENFYIFKKLLVVILKELNEDTEDPKHQKEIQNAIETLDKL